MVSLAMVGRDDCFRRSVCSSVIFNTRLISHLDAYNREYIPCSQNSTESVLSIVIFKKKKKREGPLNTPFGGNDVLQPL